MAKITMLIPDDDLALIDGVAQTNRTAFMITAAKDTLRRHRERLDEEIGTCLAQTAAEDRALATEFAEVAGDGLKVFPIRELETRLRKRNQVTVPAEAVKYLGLLPGDRIMVEFALDGTLILRALRRSYAGALAGVYGSPEEVAAFVTDERSGWS